MYEFVVEYAIPLGAIIILIALRLFLSRGNAQSSMGPENRW